MRSDLPQRCSRRCTRPAAYLSLLASLLLIRAPPGFALEPLRVAQFHYPPIVIHPQQTRQDLPGYASELVVDVFARAGRPVTLVPRPLTRAIAEVLRREVDGIAALNLRAVSGIRFSTVPVSALRIGCFTRDDTAWVYRGRESLRGMRLGTVGGYYYAYADPDFQAHIDAGEGVRAVTGPGAQRSLIGMLLARRIDVFCNDVAHVEYTRSAYFPERTLRRAGGLRGTIFAYFVMNASDPQTDALIEAFDAGLRRAYDDGTVRRVLEHYGFFRVAEGEGLYQEMVQQAHR